MPARRSQDHCLGSQVIYREAGARLGSEGLLGSSCILKEGAGVGSASTLGAPAVCGFPHSLPTPPSWGVGWWRAQAGVHFWLLLWISALQLPEASVSPPGNGVLPILFQVLSRPPSRPTRSTASERGSPPTAPPTRRSSPWQFHLPLSHRKLP